MENNTEYLRVCWEDSDSFHTVYIRVTYTSRNGIWKKGHFVAELQEFDEEEDKIKIVKSRKRVLLKKDTVSFKKSFIDEFGVQHYKHNNDYELVNQSDISKKDLDVLNEIEFGALNVILDRLH